jgi:hypothetical protein
MSPPCLPSDACAISRPLNRIRQTGRRRLQRNHRAVVPELDQPHVREAGQGGANHPGDSLGEVGSLKWTQLYRREQIICSTLDQDHATARQLAEGIAADSPGVVDPETVRTNIVFADPESLGVGAPEMRRRLASSGVLCKVVGKRLRLVTHRDVSAEHIQQALTHWRRAATSASDG